MSAPVLLDSSFLIAFEQETAKGVVGPARTYLRRLQNRRLVVSVVSVAEILEGAEDEARALAALRTFSIQGVHLGHAQRYAKLQRRSARRLGENDAWILATAEVLQADLLGDDRRAFQRLGRRYLQFTASPEETS